MGGGDGVVDAHKLFDRMPERNEVLGYAMQPFQLKLAATSIKN